MADKRVRNQVLSDDLAKKLLYKCMTCNKPIEGFYARIGTSGTCSRVCTAVEEKKPKYGDHTEESFLKRFNLE